MCKQNAADGAFKELITKLDKHTKVKHILYQKLEMQAYLKNENLTTEETQVLAAVRSKCVKNVKMNFKRMYQNDLSCPLQCNTTVPQIDSQEHILTCTILNPTIEHNTVLSDVYATDAQQECSAKAFSKLIRRRKLLLDRMENSLPGVILDQCTSRGAATVLCV
jgi:hypothetical protein